MLIFGSLSLLLGSCALLKNSGMSLLQDDIGKMECAADSGTLVESHGGLDFYEKWVFDWNDGCVAELKTKALAAGFQGENCYQVCSDDEDFLAWSDPEVTHYYSVFKFENSPQITWIRMTT